MGTGTNWWQMDVGLCCCVVVYVLVCARSVEEEGHEGRYGEEDERETMKSAGRLQGRIRRGNSLQEEVIGVGRRRSVYPVHARKEPGRPMEWLTCQCCSPGTWSVPACDPSSSECASSVPSCTQSSWVHGTLPRPWHPPWHLPRKVCPR